MLTLVTSMAKIDFGLQIEPQYGFNYEEIRQIADACETLGFESIWVSDHFFMTMDSFHIPCLECWTILSALSRDTKTLRLGPMVTAQSYRNPALLANMAASLDHISQGRFNFGIGAGWKEAEYRAYGYPYPKPSIRIEQLNEAIQIVKKLWTQDAPLFSGRYYVVERGLCFPKPLQKPYIPIWVGGTGTLTLKVAARHADACNFSWTLPPNEYIDKLEILKRHCREMGRDYDSIRKSAGLMITMAATRRALTRKLQQQNQKWNTPYMRYLSRQRPNLVGTPDIIAAKIREYISLGVNHFILRFHYKDEVASMNLFIDEVMNQL